MKLAANVTLYRGGFDMGSFSSFFTHLRSGSSSRNYYSSMNKALLKLNNLYTMLHYPLYQTDEDSFVEAQENLTDYCLSLLPEVKDKTLLEVGCGNGVQAQYILKKYNPAHFKGIDLNEGNIEIAKLEDKKNHSEQLEFCVDDAQLLATVEDNSVDLIINIESAFHYPEKVEFLKQIYRTLKPGGSFVIADLLTTKTRGNRLVNIWGKKMSYHHWSLDSYQRELPEANFQSLYFADITREVIKGFSCYRRWLRDMEKRHFVEEMILKLYYTIHVRVNMYLLRTSRQYYVITGKKPG